MSFFFGIEDVKLNTPTALFIKVAFYPSSILLITLNTP